MAETRMFPPHAQVRVKTEHLELAARVARKLGADEALINVYNPEGPLQPWFCFDIGDRAFGLWTHTGELFEAEDEYGAMGTDPIDISQLEPSADVLDLTARLRAVDAYADQHGCIILAARMVHDWRNGTPMFDQATGVHAAAIRAILRGEEVG